MNEYYPLPYKDPYMTQLSKYMHWYWILASCALVVAYIAL